MTWKGNFMTDGYAERRREYVANVRKSFEEEPQYAGRRQEEERQTGEFFSFFKIRLFLAVCLLGAFLYCRYTGTKIFHYSAEQIVELGREPQTAKKERIFLNDEISFIR